MGLLYLVRHGQAGDDSGEGHELTILGKNQSKKAGKSLTEIKFDKVFISSLKRCVQSFNSMKPYINVKNSNVFITSNVSEVKPDYLNYSKRVKFFDYFRRRSHFKRVKTFLDEFSKSGEDWLLVGHGTFFRILLMFVLGKSFRATRVRFFNSSVSVIELGEFATERGYAGKFYLRVFFLNNVSHLKKEEYSSNLLFSKKFFVKQKK